MGETIMGKLKLIYEPKGKAREYADLACNPYRGCTHGCRYCFAKRFNPDGYHKAANPKDNIIERLEKDLDILIEQYQPLSDSGIPEILFSFQGDCYQPAEMNYKLMPKIIRLLRERNFSFTILTKGGKLAIRDFELLQGYEHFRFGTTLIFAEQEMATYWEPDAAPIQNRIDTVMQAKMYGFKTWISLEPVIDPEQALQLIDRLHGYVDHWKIGKINYQPDIEKRVDWIQFMKDAKHMLDQYNASYYFKKSLTEL